MELFQIAASQLEKEYQVFLDYLEVNDVQLSAKTSMIGKKDCFAINQKFDIVSERYHSAGRTQEYYTVIDFFYFFLVRSGILQIVPEKRGKRVLRRSDRYYHFMDMLSIEKYILMVSVWLTIFCSGM